MPSTIKLLLDCKRWLCLCLVCWASLNGVIAQPSISHFNLEVAQRNTAMHFTQPLQWGIATDALFSIASPWLSPKGPVFVLAQAQGNSPLAQEGINWTGLLLAAGIAMVLLLVVAVILLVRSNRQRKQALLALKTKTVLIEQINATMSETHAKTLIQAEALRRQNVENERQREELAQLNTMKDRMISIISHDFRSPLNSLRGVLPLLQGGMLSPDQVDDVIKDINKRLNHNLNLIENLLRWTRSQLVGIKMEPVKFALDETAREVAQLLEGLAADKKLSLVEELPENLMVRGDKDMITFVVRNFVANSIKFTMPGGTITLHAHREGNQAVVRVTDTGIGMPQERVKTLFELSANKSTPGTSKEKGTGLGLLLCQQFIHAHGGEISVESEFEKGSAFSFFLPLADSEQSNNITANQISSMA